LSNALARLQAVEEALAHLATWECSYGLEALEMVKGIPLLLDDLTYALKAIAANLSEGPFDPAVPAMLDDEIAWKVNATAVLADELEALFRQKHAADLERLERPGAEMWDASRNQ
jgi:hypothetical protein